MDIPAHIHLHETAHEVAEAQDNTGQRALEHLETPGLVSPFSQLVYAAGREHVSDVWVAGQYVLKDCVLTTLDQQAIIARAQQWGEKIQVADEHPEN